LPELNVDTTNRSSDMTIRKDSWAYNFVFGHKFKEFQPKKISRCRLWWRVIGEILEDFVGPIFGLVVFLSLIAFAIYEWYMHPIAGSIIFYFLLDILVTCGTRDIKYPVTPLQLIGYCIGFVCRQVAKAARKVCPEHDVE
jgi:hypothetical protein